MTPVAVSRPNAEPPESTIAWTCCTVLTGSSRSVSRVPGRAAAHVDAADGTGLRQHDRAARWAAASR